MRANRALGHQVPYIAKQLEESEESLKELSDTLPAIESQVSEIRAVYDSGRKEVSCCFTPSFPRYDTVCRLRSWLIL